MSHLKKIFSYHSFLPVQFVLILTRWYSLSIYRTNRYTRQQSASRTRYIAGETELNSSTFFMPAKAKSGYVYRSQWQDNVVVHRHHRQRRDQRCHINEKREHLVCSPVWHYVNQQEQKGALEL